jgi:hypothetical protein
MTPLFVFLVAFFKLAMGTSSEWVEEEEEEDSRHTI